MICGSSPHGTHLIAPGTRPGTRLDGVTGLAGEAGPGIDLSRGATGRRTTVKH